MFPNKRLYVSCAFAALLGGGPVVAVDTSHPHPCGYQQLALFGQGEPEAPPALPTSLYQEDPANEDNFFSAYLFEDGTLRFSASGTYAARQEQYLLQSLETFAGRVNSIEDEWRIDQKTEYVSAPNENLAEMNRALSQGVDRETAALGTRLGRQAAANGYTQVRFEEVTESRLRGTTPRLAQARVRFSKPN